MDKIGSGVEETMFDELIEDLRRAQTLKNCQYRFQVCP